MTIDISPNFLKLTNAQSKYCTTPSIDTSPNFLNRLYDVGFVQCHLAAHRRTSYTKCRVSIYNVGIFSAIYRYTDKLLAA